jgi:hypothetical protein
MISTVNAYSLIGFGVVPEPPYAVVLLVLLNLLADHVATNPSGSQRKEQS